MQACEEKNIDEVAEIIDTKIYERENINKIIKEQHYTDDQIIYIIEKIRPENQENISYLTLNIANEKRKVETMELIKDEILARAVARTLKGNKKKLEYYKDNSISPNARKAILESMQGSIDDIIEQMQEEGIPIKVDDLLYHVMDIDSADLLCKTTPVKENEKIEIAKRLDGIEEIEDIHDWLVTNTDIYNKMEGIKKVDKKPLDLPNNLHMGVELEAAGIGPELVKELLFKNENCHNLLSSKWKIKRDSSIKNGGVELASPILNSSAESMQQIQCGCDMLKTMGEHITQECATHIHMGIDYFDGNLKPFENLVNIWKEAEELFYKISNKEGEVPRKNIMIYATPVADLLRNVTEDGSVTIESDSDYEDVIDSINGPYDNRYYGLNLYNLKYTDLDTIEFRIPNGTLEPEIIEQNIMLYGKLMEVSKELSNEKNTELQDKFRKFQSHNLTEEEKVDSLLDLLFEKEEEKKIYKNRWESVKDKKEVFEKFKAEDQTFTH